MTLSIPIDNESFLNWFIWSLDGTITSTTTPGWSGPGSNGNDGILYRSLEIGTHDQTQFSVQPRTIDEEMVNK